MEYETLIKRINPKLKAISHKVKARYTYCDEDDFYQEALLYLWLCFNEGKLADKTDSYILQGSYFFLKNYIRKICKGVDQNSISLYDETNEDGQLVSEVLTTQTYSLGDNSIEVFLLLDETGKRFTSREKDVFYYQLEGYTTREIGRKIGVSHVMVVRIESMIREKCRCLRDEF